MHRTTMLLFGLACVIGGALLYGLTVDSPAPPEPIVAAVPDPELAGRLDRVEVRLERLAEALERRPLVAARDTSAATSPTPGAAKRAPTPLAGPTLATKGRAPSQPKPKVQPQPVETFAGRSYESLAQEARKLVRGPKKDTAGAIKRWRALLARKLADEDRNGALMGLGVAQREHGDYEKAETTFRKVLDEAPSGSAVSDSARLQLGATHFWQREYREALKHAEHVRDNSSLEFQVVNARWMTVTCMIGLGDKAGARSELESMIADYKGKKGMEPLLRQYRSQLAQLE